MPQPSRIKQEANITRVSEAVASKVEINWDVVTNNASIHFWVHNAITENGEFIGLKQDTRPEFSPLHVNFASIVGRTFLVPIAYDAQGNVTATAPVPALLIMGAIKTAFDELYAEKMAEMYPEITVTPTVTVTPTISETPTASEAVTPTVSDTPTVTPEASPLPSVTPTPSAE